jgi:hypothetical protein
MKNLYFSILLGITACQCYSQNRPAPFGKTPHGNYRCFTDEIVLWRLGQVKVRV